jgi:hypothetical protein
MNVVNPPDLVDQNLYAGLIVCVKRSSFFLIDNQDIAGIGFGHDLNGVRCDYALSKAAACKPE